MAVVNKLHYARVLREAGGLGDSVRVISVCQGIKEKYKDYRVHYYSVDFLKYLLEPRTKHCVDLFLGFPCGIRPRDTDWKSYKHLLRNEIEYDITIDSWCPAYLHEPATKGIVALDRVQLWNDVGNLPFSRPKLNILKEDIYWMNRQKETVSKEKCVIGIQVGATCSSRDIPYNKVNKLIQLLLREGCHVILFDVCYRWVKDIDTKNVQLSINDDWNKTIGRILSTSLIVTPDSGFFHLTGALYHRTLGIFGCTSGQIMSRPYLLEKATHHYLELTHNEIDYNALPAGCQPKCCMRWERGWNWSRYRDVNRKNYCELIQQMPVELMFEKIRELTNNFKEKWYEREYNG